MKAYARLETKLRDLLDRMSSDRLVIDLGRELNKLGQDAVKFARSSFLSGGTTETSTAVRSGTRRRAYAAKVRRVGSRHVLDYGPIRAPGGVVPTHVRVLEGIDAAGNEVSQFVIRPKKPGGYLVFPLRKGGGLKEENIIGWRKVRQVVLRPRPTFPAIKEKLEREIPEMIQRVFAEVFP